ncbi:hypothetical protein ACK1IP_001944 [Salmonella enterica]
MKENQIRGLVNELRDIAIEYHGTQQLRERIARTVRAALLQGSQPVSNHDELPYAQVKAVADLYALCWQSGEVVTYTPAPEKATIWLNNYSGTCVQEYVKLERLQEALAGNSPVTPDGLNIRAVAALREAVRNQWLKSEDFADKVYWKSMHDIANEIVSAMLEAAPQQEVK